MPGEAPKPQGEGVYKKFIYDSAEETVSGRDRQDTHTRPIESHAPFISGSGVQTQTAHTPLFFTLAGRHGHTNPDLGRPSANKPPPSRREGSEGQSAAWSAALGPFPHAAA